MAGMYLDEFVSSSGGTEPPVGNDDHRAVRVRGAISPETIASDAQLITPSCI